MPKSTARLAHDHRISFSAANAKRLGGIQEAILFEQFTHWTDEAAANDGWFCKPAREISQATALNRYQLERARGVLIALGLLEEQLTGIPARMWRRIHHAPVAEPIIRNGHNRRARHPKVEIPPEIRWAVWERDNFTCQQCGARQPLAVDHIHPESKGGTLDLDNLQTLCVPCNNRKGARV